MSRHSKDLAYLLLYNRITVGLIVLAVGAGYIVLKAVDRAFHLKLRQYLSAIVHDASRDRLTVIRKAQISSLFRRKYRLKKIRMALAGGSYWMSIPVIISGVGQNKKEQKYLGKIIDDASILKHRYMTFMRNLGVFATGAGPTFDEYTDPRDMVEYERDSLLKLRARGIAVPEVHGVHRLNEDDYMLVMEFIDGLPLSKVELTDTIVGQLFATLKTMHDSGVFHGDVKLDNFLYAESGLAVVDCLKIHEGNSLMAQDFDLINAICALAQKVPVPVVIEQALKHHSEEELRRSCRLIDIALNKVDLDLPPERIKEIVDRLGSEVEAVERQDAPA